MKPSIASTILILGLCLPTPAHQQPAQPDNAVPRRETGYKWPARVSDNGRYLVNAVGEPFFWLGDTAWMIFQNAIREHVDVYFATRARQGFTVIQAAIVMADERVGGTLRPNLYGDQAFVAGNPAEPIVTPGRDVTRTDEYDYWDHVDFIVGRARAHGLALGLLPHFVGFAGPGYRYLTAERAFRYGTFLGRRYRNHPHVFWILGGDNVPDTASERIVWDEMARGIALGATTRDDYSRVLMTYHVNGQFSSSEWLHQTPWLDFNMIQIWGSESDIYPRVLADYRLTPVKPTGLGEGSYEDGPQYPTRPINALNIRRQAYWSFLAGGYYTYGNTNIWSFGLYQPEVTQDWLRALDSPGATHLSVLARVFTSLEWWRLAPDPSLFAAGAGSGTARNAAMSTAAGDFGLVYLASSAPATLNLRRLTAAVRVRVTWIDPQTGTRTAAGEFAATETVRVSAPQGWADGLLLLESIAG
jgi:hypothetical protein